MVKPDKIASVYRGKYTEETTRKKKNFQPEKKINKLAKDINIQRFSLIASPVRPHRTLFQLVESSDVEITTYLLWRRHTKPKRYGSIIQDQQASHFLKSRGTFLSAFSFLSTVVTGCLQKESEHRKSPE